MAVGPKTCRLLKHVWRRLVDPLRIDDSSEMFTLSIPEAQTTTADSVRGWSKRPPALLRCSGCEAGIPQRRASTDIDCPNCYRVFRPHDFADLDLLGLFCPRCSADMQHGIRHPNVFDIPEWATCPDCQYHWDLDLWFSAV